jgi:hypothetical protein
MVFSDVEWRIELEVKKQSSQATDKEVEKIRDTIVALIDDCWKNEEINEKTLAYNIPFFVQALLRSSTTLLRLDTPKQVLYPQKNVVIPLTKNKVVDTALRIIPAHWKLWYFIQNLEAIWREFTAKKQEIQEALETWNLVIISNHTSWMNLPIIAICLHRYCGISKEKIYTLLWPAITTRHLSYSMINFSNLVKTVPDTQNGNIIPEEIAQEIRKSMFETIKPIFRQEKGNVLLVAPSWTTDKYDEKTGSFSVQRPTDGTNTLLKYLSAKSKVLVIGINDKAVMPDNSWLRKWEVYVQFW